MRHLGDSQGAEHACQAGHIYLGKGGTKRSRNSEQPPDTALAPAGGTGTPGFHPATHWGVAQGSPALQFAEDGPAFITKLQIDELPG